MPLSATASWEGYDRVDVALEGSISRLNTSAQTVVVRGVTVSYATARFSDGTMAQLANGVVVEVEAYLAACMLLLFARHSIVRRDWRYPGFMHVNACELSRLLHQIAQFVTKE